MTSHPGDEVTDLVVPKQGLTTEVQSCILGGQTDGISRWPKMAHGREGGSSPRGQSWHYDDVFGGSGACLGDHMKQGTVDARAGPDISWSHPHSERADVLTHRN